MQLFCVAWPLTDQESQFHPVVRHTMLRYVDYSRVHPFTGPDFFLLRCDGPEIVGNEIVAMEFPRMNREAGLFFAKKCVIVMAAWHLNKTHGPARKFMENARDLYNAEAKGSVKGLVFA